MVFWSRISYSRVESLTNRCKRHYSTYTAIPLHGGGAISAGLFGKVRVSNRGCLSDRYPLYSPVRFFAAPVLASKPKTEPKDETGTRLNDKIRAEFIRLVTDDGHTVVSRREALDRARNLKLDLVEVDRCAKPPVCKIMDYHREKYKRQLMEKERVKSKANGILRKSSPKEVRFTMKTDQKDLETKAEQVKRMMDKGYRVKCMAVGTEEQDLGGLLARLSALIEDVAVVESGPMVEKKQAYTVVRHIKFGLLKKGPKKASTSQPSSSLNPEVVEASVEIQEESDDSQSCTESENETDHEEPKAVWSATDMNDEFEEIFGLDENKGLASSTQGPTPLLDNRYSGKRDGATQVRDRFQPIEKSKFSPAQGPTPVLDNRYSGKRDGPTQVRDRFQPKLEAAAAQVNRGPGVTPVIPPQGPTPPVQNRYAGVRSKFQPTVVPTERATNSGPRGPENRYGGPSEVRSRIQPTMPTRDNSQVRPGYQSGVRPTEMKVSRVEASRSENPVGPTEEVLKSQRPGFGIFSAPKHAVPSRPSVVTEAKSEESRRPESDKVGKWGIFGGDVPKVEK